MTKFLKNNFRFILIIFCATLFSFANAQEKTKKDSTKSYFKFTGSYLTNAVYNGRKDSLSTPYITPSFGYFNKSGFYIGATASYLVSATESRIDVFNFELGYDHDFTDKLNGSFYAEKSFYNQSSTAIKSDMKGSMGASLSYDFDLLQIEAGADLSFATKTDISVNFGLGHVFSFGEDDRKFSITPKALANMSTLHFYEGYTNRKVGKKAKQTMPNLLSVSSITTVDNNKFTLLDYELSIPIAYDTKRIGVFFIPTFALPQNPIHTTTTTVYKFRNGSENTVTQNSTPQSEKNLGNIFYAELGIYLKF